MCIQAEEDSQIGYAQRTPTTTLHVSRGLRIPGLLPKRKRPAAFATGRLSFLVRNKIYLRPPPREPPSWESPPRKPPSPWKSPWREPQPPRESPPRYPPS